MGGSDGTHSLCTTEVLDMAENCWKPGPTMTTCRTNVSVAVVGDRLWAVGGFSGKVSNRQNICNLPRRPNELPKAPSYLTYVVRCR